MPEIQSAGGAVWGAGTTVQGAGGAVWGAGATVQSIGSTYTPPAAPPGATTIPDGSLAPLTEILPAAAYRSAHTPVLRNIRVVGDPLKFFNAPLKTDARDIMPSPATATLSGVPTFDGDGMTCPPGVRVFFEPHVLENQKLFADGYTVGIEYRVRVRNATVVPPGFNTNAVYIFSIYGFGQQVGFLMSGSTLYAHDYAGNIRAFEAPLGALPLDCVLSVAYPAGSGTAQLKINGVVVFTSTINSRIQSGIALGLQSVTGVNALKYSELRLERATVVTNGVSFTDGTILLATEGSVSLPDNATMWRLSATIPRADYETMRAGAQPPYVSLLLGGETWAFLVDEMDAPRAFASTDVTIRGVSLAALADAPYELVRQWTNEAPTTAAQMATLAQTFTGLGVTWGLPDWTVATGAWSFSGSPWGVVVQAAAPVGAVVEAHALNLSVSVTSRYPVMPNLWATTPPDAQIPWAAVESEQVSPLNQPAYTGVYVTGPSDSLAAVRLAGTSGAEQAPLVTNALLTDMDGQVEHARTVLAASGLGETVTRTLQVLTAAGQPGRLKRGHLVRWVDPTVTWTGMVRGVSVSWGFGQVRQTVACERRLSFPTGTYEITT